MREFSRRTVAALRAALPLRLALPALEPFLEDNVAKEIRKDRLMIRHAAAALAAGRAPDAALAAAVLAEARAIDREFLERVGAFPVRIRIPYGELEPIRLRRVQLGLQLAHRILAAWQVGRRARETFAQGELAALVHQMLRLYAEETLALSDSVRLPALLGPLRRRLADTLRNAMLEAASALTRASPVAAQKR